MAELAPDSIPAIDRDWSEHAEILPVVDAVEWRLGDKHRDVGKRGLCEEKGKIAVGMTVRKSRDLS